MGSRGRVLGLPYPSQLSPLSNRRHELPEEERAFLMPAHVGIQRREILLLSNEPEGSRAETLPGVYLGQSQRVEENNPGSQSFGAWVRLRPSLQKRPHQLVLYVP